MLFEQTDRDEESVQYLEVDAKIYRKNCVTSDKHLRRLLREA